MKGLRVLVTRAVPDNIALAQLLTEKGAVPILCPTLEIQPLDCTAAFQAVTNTLSQYAAAAFVSRNAVKNSLPRILQHWPISEQKRLFWAAVGHSSAEILQQYGISNVIYPLEQGGAALLPDLLAVCPAQAKVVIFKGEGGLQDLQAGLHANDVKITEIDCYRRVKLAITAQAAKALETGGIDVMIATSGESLEQLRHMLEKWPQFLQQPLIVVSQRLQTLARQQGFTGLIRVAASADNAAVSAEIDKLRI